MATLQVQVQLPEVIVRGMVAYKSTGGKDAVAIWLKGSPIENDPNTKITGSGGLAQIETVYRKMIGFEPIRLVRLSPSLLRAYLVVKFEGGPVFFTLDCYRADKEWRIYFLDFNSKPAVALPAEILTGSAK